MSKYGEPWEEDDERLRDASDDIVAVFILRENGKFGL